MQLLRHTLEGKVLRGNRDRIGGRGVAIDPDTVLAGQQEPLTPADKRAVARIEKSIDKYLGLNYYPDGAATYYFEEHVSKAVVLELAKLYREAGWAISVHGSGTTSDYSRPAFILSRLVSSNDFTIADEDSKEEKVN